jgi:hypothetical protein
VYFMKPDYMDESCDCGHDEACSAWFDANPHSADCYQTELYADGLLRPAHLEKAFDDACKERNRHKWDSPKYKAAQRKVTAAHDAMTSHDDAIRKALCKKHHIQWNDGKASMCHCTCGREELWQAWIRTNTHGERCPIEMPNFWHKPSGLKVCWYKYIGRDMEIAAKPTVEMTLFDMFTEVLHSFGGQGLEDANAALLAAEDEEARATRETFSFLQSEAGQEAMRALVDQGVIHTFGTEPEPDQDQ